MDSAGYVYVVDSQNQLIRKITSAGAVTTLAGSGSVGSINANGTSASFNYPNGAAVDSAGNVYVVDSENQSIRKINPAGDVTTLAGSGSVGSTDANGTSASFYYPFGVDVDSVGNVYVADGSNNLIRKINPTGDVTTLAGSGSVGSTDANGTSASFRGPKGVAVDSAGFIYVADSANNLIRKITPDGDVTTLAGSGTAGSTNGNGTSASFNNPWGLTVDIAGNVYVADTQNHLIRKITPEGEVTTLAGSGSAGSTNSSGTSASFNSPYQIAVDSAGNVYVTDSVNHLIRKITQ